MNNDKEQLIIDYLNGELSQAQQEDVERMLADGSEMQQMLDQYSEIDTLIANETLEQPSARLRGRFDAYLQEQSKPEESAKVISMPAKRFNWMQAAAAAAILVIGVLAGVNYSQNKLINNYNQQQQNQTNNHYASMLSAGSVTSRIHAIQVNQIETEDTEKFISSLLNIMKDDSSPNVRLAAVEALQDHTHHDRVKTAMIDRLESEKDPFVLITLIGTLSHSGDQRAIAPLTSITEGDFDNTIKDEAHIGLQNIKIQKI